MLCILKLQTSCDELLTNFQKYNEQFSSLQQNITKHHEQEVMGDIVSIGIHAWKSLTACHECRLTVAVGCQNIPRYTGIFFILYPNNANKNPDILKFVIYYILIILISEHKFNFALFFDVF